MHQPIPLNERKKTIKGAFQKCSLSNKSKNKYVIHTLITGAQPEIFQGRGGFVELGHLDKPSSKTQKKAPQGKILELFLIDTLKTRF